MKIITPVILLSFIFFAAVAANDFTEPDADYELDALEDSDDMLGNDFDYDDGENEDIVYTGMVSAKPPTPSLPTSSSMIKSPSPPVCKKWRCSMNGYIPNWKPNAISFCTKDYLKLSIYNKAYCQENYCEKTCASF